MRGLYPIAFSVTQYPNNTSSFRLWNDGEIDETFNISFGNSIEDYTIASGNYIDLDLASLENNITITPEHRSDLSKDFNFEFGPGDTNLDNAINILDLIVIVNYIIGNINLSNSQIVLSDFNNDGLVDILDVTSIINSLINN